MMVDSFLMIDGKTSHKFLAEQRITVGVTADGHRRLSMTLTSNNTFSIAITDAYDSDAEWIDVATGDLGGSFPTVRMNDDLRAG
jgi:hypothetical protein